jgi:hypothetical protein
MTIVNTISRNLLWVLIFSLILILNTNAQSNKDQVYVDKEGIMRWRSNNVEILGFGVNYTLPFAHEYRMALKSGVPMEDIIRQDVYHMARLGLDLYRVHVWDTEISDSLGNLLTNEHLKLFDFTVNEMKQRGFKFIITPIAFWGNGWPEDDQKTAGFSYKYGKDACLTNPAAIEAQANYLAQFLEHINPYTGLAYKNDPSVLAFEISNEPHHNELPEKVTAYINKMVFAMRKTGCGKPVFYNMSHSIQLVDAYLNADIQGGTFQWYPTGLVASHQINGNFLPHVTDYTIPFGENPRFKKMAKIVYEFDPADAGGNYMIPAMAVAFRKAGMQLAAQFAYDALIQAPYNTNYGTHFMNLAYAPQKAISLRIASAVFHQKPLLKQTDDPEKFKSLNISYTQDLAEWITDKQFFYSNNTLNSPGEPAGIEEIAGYGSSPMIKYNGTGAYFLDKIAEGIWRLEVMPDAYWIDDPYGPVGPNRQKAAVMHNPRTMVVRIPALGLDFTITPLNNNRNCHQAAQNGEIVIFPGVYLLKNKASIGDYLPDHPFKNIRLGEYVAPATNLTHTIIRNFTADEVTENKPFTIEFDVISPDSVTGVTITMSSGGRWKSFPVVKTGTDTYQCSVPADMVIRGFLSYSVIITNEHDTITFPSGLKGNPWGWENRNNSQYQIRIVPGKSELILWEADSNWDNSYKVWDRNIRLLPCSDGSSALSIKTQTLPLPDPDNTTGPSYAFRFYFGSKIKGRVGELPQKEFLVIKAINHLNTPQPLEAGIIDKNGVVLSATCMVNTGEPVYKIPLNTLSKAELYILPRPFPDFLPLKVPSSDKTFDISASEAIQVVIKSSDEASTDLEIEKIWLE